jgi:nitrosocyanin
LIIGAFAMGGNNTDADSTADTVATATPSPSIVPVDGSASDTATPTPAATGATKEFTVTASNFAFSPKEIKVRKGDTVKITFKSSGGSHDWKLDEFNVKTAVIGSGKEETISFVADKTGTFEYYCSVGSHRQMGMKGNLVVE